MNKKFWGIVFGAAGWVFLVFKGDTLRDDLQWYALSLACFLSGIILILVDIREHQKETSAEDVNFNKRPQW